MGEEIKFLNAVTEICNIYDASKKKSTDEKHSVFRIISDLYYRENFHSDILRYFLDPSENHKCGLLFLSSFIQMLNQHKRCISPLNYTDAKVVREKEKIDILIFSPSTMRAIIIENKINNAPDMNRQLPRYYDDISSAGYNIEAIVYIPLDITKRPSKSDWTEEDRRKCDPLITIIPAFCDNTYINLVSNWIEPLINKVSDDDVRSTIRQYSELIKSLNSNYMDTKKLEHFYTVLLKEDNKKIAQLVREMVDEMPSYMAYRIFDKYQSNHTPFTQIWIYKGNDVVFGESEIKNVWVKIDVICSLEKYEVRFWTIGDYPNIDGFITLINKIKCLSDAERHDEWGDSALFKYFDFNKENELFEFLDILLKELFLASER